MGEAPIRYRIEIRAMWPQKRQTAEGQEVELFKSMLAINDWCRDPFVWEGGGMGSVWLWVKIVTFQRTYQPWRKAT